MQVFKVEVPGLEPTTVFAADYDHAAAVFTTAFYATRESMPDHFQITRLPWGESDEDRHMREALDRHVSGIGEYNPERGWTIDMPAFDPDPD